MIVENRDRNTLGRKVENLLTDCGVQLEYVHCLAKGYHHNVYLYQVPNEKARVVKIPTPFRFAGIVHSAKQEKENAEIVARVFDQFAVLTEVISSKKGYCIIMDAIQGEPLQPELIDITSVSYQPELREQLLNIVEGDKQLLRSSGRFLDLTGPHALFDELQRPFGKKRKKELSNIFVEETHEGRGGKLRIIDNDLITLRSGNIFERFKSQVVFIANYRALLRDFGIDIKPNKQTLPARKF